MSHRLCERVALSEELAIAFENDPKSTSGRQVDANTNTEPARSLIIGGTGLVGGYIVEHLVRRGERPLVLSRSQRDGPGIDWIRGDLTQPDTLTLPPFATLYCTADPILLADPRPRPFSPPLKLLTLFP